MNDKGVWAGLALVALVISSCGDGGSSMGPTGIGGRNPMILVDFVTGGVGGGGAFTATLNSQTFTAEGGHTVTLAPGTYQISGSFQVGLIEVVFATVGNGGVLSGSVRNVGGPTPMVSQCSVAYIGGDGLTVGQYPFALQFQVTTDVGSACQGF